MARNWFTYTIRPEAKDGTLRAPVAHATTKARALKIARGLAKGEALDDLGIVVMQRPEGGDRLDDTVIATFEFKS